ncbi:SusD/RagB family nutrient-binding outer membrane lipoprotein [Lacihabitans sp. CCS-44]|uniref:SusD/RagB family nutrient-binding outer membrane lipoprotein n=1 Tax=Lacihabitans sp. CCS-44 TaxID=2487331 RepID=UPI0020CCB450|nr:SusD/RagB family nutrient-binding outer membrane lipoprotein [Lacihabitans sp. CCS-44]MCP9757522.1 SusD/RagB family nutrient-binding outer membrane lipoprotein [Lacihabitans sp. CCS-44]
MRNIFRKKWSFVFTLIAFSFASCDKGFDELNINKTAATALNPVFILNNATVNSSFPASTVFYEVGIVQQMVSPNSGVLTGANFNQDSRDNTVVNWQRYYRNVVRNTKDVLLATKDLPARSNLYNMARILQSYAFMILTDSYGDVPYSEAGKGYSDQIVLPKYESQQAIYAGIIKELTEASAALDASKTIEAADVLYGGDVAKWKKFGNSLLLRAGMRLSKIDPTQAAQIVAKAVSGGLMTSNADNALVRHDANYTNGIGITLNATEAANVFIAAPFANYLKNTKDPRLKSIAVRYVGAKSGVDMVAAKASTDPSVQIGMPFGYDNSTISGPVKDLSLASFYDFSQVDRTRMVKTTAPMFLVTYSQTQLLLAEAVQRGWTTGSVETLFKNGVKAHMEQLATYDANSAVAPADIDAYFVANTFDAAKALEQINTQYWVSSFLNGPEAFANFRRSGFPVLTPNPFPGKGIKGNFINRLTYPNSEISVNSVNVKEAIGRQGADDLDTKVWWDK